MQGSDHLSRSTLQTSFRLSRLCESVICESLCMHTQPINQPRLVEYICMWPLALFVTSRFEQPGGYYCTCEPGWTGPECSIDVDECSSDPCRNGGICIDQQNSYYCQCLPGYTGNQLIRKLSHEALLAKFYHNTRFTIFVIYVTDIHPIAARICFINSASRIGYSNYSRLFLHQRTNHPRIISTLYFNFSFAI